MSEAPNCIECKHFHSKNLAGITCDAFPNGIPSDIVDNVIEHTKPYKGDNGIQFEKKD